jgi:hypothetical protein
MRKVVCLVALLVLGAMVAMCQTHDMSAMLPSTTIDGSQTPDQIPDALAFRLWLIAHTQADVNDNRHTIKLLGADANILETALNTFRTKHRKFSAERIADTVSRETYWSNTDSLAQELLISVQSKLSAHGLTTLGKFLQKYKGGISLSPYDHGLGAIAERNIAERNMVAGVPQINNMISNYSMSYENELDFPYLSYAATFTGGGRALPASHWTTTAGRFIVTISAVNGFNDGLNMALDKEKSWDAAQCSQTTIYSITPGTISLAGVGVRMGTDASGKAQGYIALFSPTRAAVYIVIGGVQYLENTSVPWTLHNGDVISMCAMGSDIYTMVNSTNIGLDVNSNTFTSGSPGISAYNMTGYPPIQMGPGIQFDSGWAYYHNATLSGDTICQGSCPGNAQHTANVTVKLGSAGGTVYGNTVPAQNPTGVQNIQTFDLCDECTPPVIVLDGQVLCSVVGLFFENPGSGGGGNGTQIAEEWAVTTVQNVGVNPILTNIFDIIPKCTSQSSPPDFDPDVYYLWPYNVNNPLPPDYLYIKGKTFCVGYKTSGGAVKWDCGAAVALSPLVGIGKLIKGLSVDQYVQNAKLPPAGHGDGLYPTCTNFFNNQVGWWPNDSPPN